MELRISKSQFSYMLLILAILLQNCFFRIINPSSTVTMLLMMVIALLFLLAMASRLYGAGNYVKKYIFAVFGMVMIPQSIYAFMQGESISGYIDVVRGPFGLLLSLPILYIMFRKQSIESVLNVVTILTTIALAILLVNTFFLNTYGRSLLPFDYYQKPDIIRNGRYRLFLISDFLSFTAIYSFCKFINNTRKNKWFIISFLVCFISEIYIEQTRVIIMTIAAACVIVYSQSLKKNKIWFYFAAVVFVLVGLFGDWFAQFVGIFSTSNDELGISTKIRMYEVRYALELILEHPFMGTGMVSNYLFNVVRDGFAFEYNHTDIGLLGSISYIGLFGTIVLFVAPYCRFVRTLFLYKANHKHSFEYSFMLGLIVFLTITSFTILVTDNARIFVWPFIIAIFEYSRYRLTTNCTEAINKSI